MGKMWERLLEATMGLMSVDGKLENSMERELGLDLRLVAELDWLWDSLRVHLKEISLEWCLGSYYSDVLMGKMWERFL